VVIYTQVARRPPNTRTDNQTRRQTHTVADAAQHDLGFARSFRAEAIGVPGQRRFRVLVESRGGNITIWLEKEQLHSLAVSIGRLLEIIETEFPQSAPRAPHTTVDQPAHDAAARAVSLDFQSGSWSIGYDESSHTLEFQAHDVDDDERGPAKVSFLSTMEQSRALSEEALRVYNAGRPRCPLCDASMDPGVAHVCPRGNGHSRH
jgi:uncharacterized repeat protein (TIGR03847 family)